MSQRSAEIPIHVSTENVRHQCQDPPERATKDGGFDVTLDVGANTSPLRAGPRREVKMSEDSSESKPGSENVWISHEWIFVYICCDKIRIIFLMVFGSIFELRLFGLEKRVLKKSFKASSVSIKIQVAGCQIVNVARFCKRG